MREYSTETGELLYTWRVIEQIDYRLVVAALASVVILIGAVPYIRDILAHKTKPHMYTWLIWLVTLGTATTVLISGGGGFASIGMIVDVTVVGIVFLLSFKYGTKDVTKTDLVTLVAALAAITIWWQLDNPLLAVVIASIIDGVGYFPTFRKTRRDPHTETKIYWLLAFVGSILSIAALAEFNALTLTYLITITVANAGMWLMLVALQRRALP